MPGPSKHSAKWDRCFKSLQAQGKSPESAAAICTTSVKESMTDDEIDMLVYERQFSTDQRTELAKKGFALSDGSFPIETKSDLENAIRAYGRAANKDAAKRHIIKRARALGAVKSLPEDWNVSESDAADETTEAARSTMSWEEIESRVYAAVCKKYDKPDPYGEGMIHGAHPIATYKDRVVIQMFDESHKKYQIPYKIEEGGVVVLGEPIEVVQTFAAVEADVDEALQIVKAADAAGSEWDVVLIRSGLSTNGNLYPETVLREAVSLFEGVKAFADHPSRDEERDRPERSIRDIVGWFDHVRYENGSVVGRFHVSESAEWLQTLLRDAWAQGKKDIVGFSIRAAVSGRRGTTSESARLVVEKIARVHSVDVVTVPAAGGELVELVASDRGENMDPEKLKELEAKIKALESRLSGIDEIKEALKTLTTTVTESRSSETTEVSTIKSELDALKKEREREQNRQMIQKVVSESKLPEVSQKRLVNQLSARTYTEAEVTEAVAVERDFWAQAFNANLVRGAGFSTSKMGDSDIDKKLKAVEGLIAGEVIDGVTPYRTLKEAYCKWHGLDYFDTGAQQVFEAFRGKYDSGLHHAQVQESLTTTDWAQVFADVMYNRLAKQYNAQFKYRDWRKLVSSVKSVEDFRTQHVTRIGGYGDLATVAEQATYPTVSPGGDEEVTYAVQKRGFIDDLTIETIANDKIGAIRKLPDRMALAAHRTLWKFVINTLIVDNPTMDYDTTALFHADHGNTGTTALSIAEIAVVVQTMKSLTAFGEANLTLGALNMPRYLLVPIELEQRALRIVNPSDAFTAGLTTIGTSTEHDPWLWKGKFEVMVIDEWTDADNWYMVANPDVVETIELGFLNGRQEPELFVQDQATVGSVFTADKISYKIRHVYSGDVIDHRSFYREVV